MISTIGVKEDAHPIAIDLGSCWLHGSVDNPLFDLARKLNLPLYSTSHEDSPLFDHDLESYAMIDEDGRRIDNDTVTKVSKKAPTEMD